MKKLILKLVILVVAALLSCSEKTDPDPVYTDVTGSWTFKTDVLSGDFSIIDSKSIYGYFTDSGGSFSINNKVMPIKSKVQASKGPFEITLNFYENTNTNDGDFLHIDRADISSDYKVITATNYTYQYGTTYIICSGKCGTITISRKK